MHAATYRLVVNLAGQRFVFPEQCFQRFEAVQARVANAVRAFAAYGRVTSIEAEQQLEAGADADCPPWLTGEWTTVKCWGSEVVDRVTTQDALRRTIAGVAPPVAARIQYMDAGKFMEAGFSGGESSAGGWSDGEQRWAESAPRPRWRRTRYALASSSALLAGILVCTFLWQAEGEPARLLRMLNERAPQATELPFAARPVRATVFPAMLSNWMSARAEKDAAR